MNTLLKTLAVALATALVLVAAPAAEAGAAHAHHHKAVAHTPAWKHRHHLPHRGFWATRHNGWRTWVPAHTHRPPVTAVYTPYVPPPALVPFPAFPVLSNRQAPKEVVCVADSTDPAVQVPVARSMAAWNAGQDVFSFQPESSACAGRHITVVTRLWDPWVENAIGWWRPARQLIEVDTDQATTPYYRACSLARTITHELGHSVGLEHNLDATSVMSTVGNRTVQCGTPSALDYANMAALDARVSIPSGENATPITS